MLFTHQFASTETMNRARYWLTWHGFVVEEPTTATGSTAPAPRLAIHASPSCGAAVRMLIHSIDHPAPDAEEAFATKRWVAHPAASTAPIGSSQPSGTPIHWEGPAASPSDPAAASVAEYMFSRWE